VSILKLESMKEERLVSAVLNQLEADFDDQEFDSVEELIKELVKSKPVRRILFDYLSESAQQNLREGLTVKREKE
jgi:DNA-binding SARP family transcriptional activator